MDQIAEYLHSVEVHVVTAVSSAAPDLPNVREAVNRLWNDLARHAPDLSEMRNRIPILTPPAPVPPPPPPFPKQWMTRSAQWIHEHRRTAGVIGLSMVGTMLLTGYSAVRTRRSARMDRALSASSTERRQVVVVLGGDHPLALPLILGLERKGFIVIASVESLDHVQTLEDSCRGYVRALTLDPADPDSVPFFLRSLASALSRRFPINAAGDPHVSSASQPYVHSVVCLLSLPGSSRAALPPPLAPLEHVSLQSSYLPYLQATHLMPLHLIQALLPVLRSSPARSRDKGQRSVIVCVPAADARGDGTFVGPRAMSAAATLKAVDILRQEVAAASTSTEQAAGMKQVRFVTMDIGAVTLGGPRYDGLIMDEPSDVRDWTLSEQSTYSESFVATLAKRRQRNVRILPTHADRFVRKLVDVVVGHGSTPPSFLGLGLWKSPNWTRSNHSFNGAGARTYAFTSNLPPFVLDFLLNIPSIILSIRNALLPIRPYIRRPPSDHASTSQNAKPAVVRKFIEAAPDSEQSEGEGNVDAQASGSEADVESNTEHDPSTEEGAPTSGHESMSSSWVSLGE